MCMHHRSGFWLLDSLKASSREYTCTLREFYTLLNASVVIVNLTAYCARRHVGYFQREALVVERGKSGTVFPSPPESKTDKGSLKVCDISCCVSREP